MLRTRGPRKWPIEVSIDIGRPSRERASATPPRARSATRAGALGAGLGAGVMYLLDPQVGRRRRHLAKDKACCA
jgi:hypothetical protein